MGVELRSRQRVQDIHVRAPEKKIYEAVKPYQFAEIEEKNYDSKRMVDLLIGSLAFVIYAFLFPFIAMGIKLSSRGPVLFKQKRTGKNGEIFHCYKFRTMHVLKAIQKDGKPVVTKKGDTRIFSFGQFLRKANLDELPQIVNVMKGDMSLVGPRPYPVEECAYWNNRFDDHYYRYILQPGITGFAQAKGYRGGTLEDDLMRKRLDYDLIYVEKNSLRMDLRIIWLTVFCMLTRKTNGH